MGRFSVSGTRIILKDNLPIAGLENLENTLNHFLNSIGKDTNILSTKNIGVGQTNTIRRIIETSNGKYFIKIGEKVAIENDIYNKKHIKESDLFLKNMSSLSGGDVLLLPFLDDYIDLENLFFKFGSSILNYSKQISAILDRIISTLWINNLSKKPFQGVEVRRYVDAHITPLHDEVVGFEIGERVLSLGDFFRNKIICNGQTFPSIAEMYTEITNRLATTKISVNTNILGDFQPSNILLNQVSGDIKIVDLSNYNENGDLALDFAKFFNFYNRFHLVAGQRENQGYIVSGNFLENINFTYDNEVIIINYNKILSLRDESVIEDIEQSAENLIIKKTSNYYFADQVKLYKFIVNLITLRRNVLKYPKLVELLVVMIVDSYLEIIKKVKNI